MHTFRQFSERTVDHLKCNVLNLAGLRINRYPAFLDNALNLEVKVEDVQWDDLSSLLSSISLQALLFWLVSGSERRQLVHTPFSVYV